MARSIEYKLNRVSRALAFVGGTDYAAVQLYSQGSRPIYIDALSWGVRSTTPADYALFAFNDLVIFRGVQINPTDNFTLAQILALGGIEEIYRSSRTGAGVAGPPEDFNEPLLLEPDNNYLVLNGDASLTGATAGTVSAYLCVRGRMIPDKPVEKAKYEARDSYPIPDIMANGGASEQEC